MNGPYGTRVFRFPPATRATIAPTPPNRIPAPAATPTKPSPIDPRTSPIEPGELDVAHPHPPGSDQRDDQEPHPVGQEPEQPAQGVEMAPAGSPTTMKAAETRTAG